MEGERSRHGIEVSGLCEKWLGILDGDKECRREIYEAICKLSFRDINFGTFRGRRLGSTQTQESGVRRKVQSRPTYLRVVNT